MKYMGSKRRISNKILEIISEYRNNNQCYIEPFAGGMNMIDKVKGERIANDLNFYLIEFWKKIVYENWTPPIDITKEKYYEIKENKEKFSPELIAWAGFCCSYKGKYFGGYAGKTETKFGIRDYIQESYNDIMRQKESLKGVKFISLNYYDLNIPNNSIVYCDPPYLNTTKYNGISKFDFKLYWEWVRENSRNGNFVFCSEYSAPSDFICIWEEEVKSSLSGKNKKSIEKLFIHKSKILTREYRH